ncbi:hypothetical protein [Vannielia sp. SX4]|uniref:hypothetical protein n=1 Tax=Vannielia sp. SX4 TaxID=3463852 RepID=UPI00405947D5
MTSKLLPTQSMRVYASVEHDVATVVQQTNTNKTQLDVPGAVELAAVLKTMLMPDTTPFYGSAFNAIPLDASVKIESPPYSAKAVEVPWRFITPLISDLQ